MGGAGGGAQSAAAADALSDLLGGDLLGGGGDGASLPAAQVGHRKTCPSSLFMLQGTMMRCGTCAVQST